MEAGVTGYILARQALDDCRKPQLKEGERRERGSLKRGKERVIVFERERERDPLGSPHHFKVDMWVIFG